MTIRGATTHDLNQIAAIYKEQFGWLVFRKYSEVLISEFYRSFLTRCTVLVFEDKGNITGYLVGGSKNSLEEANSDFWFHNRFRCIAETLLRPRFYWHGFKRLPKLLFGVPSIRYPSESYPNPSSLRLSCIAVREEVKGTGVAAKLLDAFEADLNGAVQYSAAVRGDNHRGLRFFAKMGFDEAGKIFQYNILLRRLGTTCAAILRQEHFNSTPSVRYATLAPNHWLNYNRDKTPHPKINLISGEPPAVKI
jgi:ribosomal protein S18 acetylase RimI-like enzyme